MRNSKFKFAITAIVLAGTIGTYFAFAHEGEGKGLMSSEGMHGEGMDGKGGMSPAITIYKSPNCGCCQSWIEHLEAHGFDTTTVETDNLNEVKQTHGVPREMASCHTALIGDLVIEGHVPAEDILAYLENPQFNTVGLSVPGMPHGTPGMETGRKDDYKVFAFNGQGQQSVFREHTDY